MNLDLLIAILNFAAKFGFDAALLIMERMNKPSATIDDAIAALHAAKEKTFEQYIEEAKARAAAQPDQPPPTAPFEPPAPIS